MSEYSTLEQRVAEWLVEADDEHVGQLFLDESTGTEGLALAQSAAISLRTTTFESLRKILATAEAMAGELEAFGSAGHSASKVEQRFEELADQWRSETRVESDITRIVLNGAYQRIIGLGRPAIPFILRRLEQRHDYWFWALAAIVGEDVAEGESTVDAAADRWLRWGRERRLV